MFKEAHVGRYGWLTVGLVLLGLTAYWSLRVIVSFCYTAIDTKVGLRLQPKGCHRRAPAHLSAYSSGDEAAGGGFAEANVP